MKILVIGGSYFYGRVFTMSACEKHELTLLNRGTYPMSGFPVNEIKADRKDAEAVSEALQNTKFDAIVDFCAYGDEDIRIIRDTLGDKDIPYIMISTVDVLNHTPKALYEGDGDGYISDLSPYEDKEIPGDIGAYIQGKIAAEKELTKSFRYTILRPTIIYGPYDYSPRFSPFVNYIRQSGSVPVITDDKGSFDCIYIRDAVNMILGVLARYESGEEKNGAYIITGKERCSYNTFLDIFYDEAKKASAEITRQNLTSKDLNEIGIPAQFALNEEEALYYDGKSSDIFLDTIGATYTGLKEGMGKAFRFFYGA